MTRPLDVATAFFDAGFFVLPAKPHGKAPMVPWKDYQDGYPREELQRLFGDLTECNYWLICGTRGGVVTVDCDSSGATALWTDILGPMLEQTTTSKTRKGQHYMWRAPEGDPFKGWSVHKDGIDYDVRGYGSGVIVPPSVHQSGHIYRWIRDLSFLQPMPGEIMQVRERDTGGDSEGTGGHREGRSVLAALLASPPPEGGRNEWLAKVCGHFAKQTPFRDAYDAQVALAAGQLHPPLTPEEVEKTANSIWSAERNKTSQAAGGYREEAGYLIGDGRALYTEAGNKQSVQDAPWANFDIVARGVILSEDAQRTYDVIVHREGHTPTTGMLPGSVLGSPMQLSQWLAARGGNVIPPGNDLHRAPWNSRLQRYLESQNPPKHIAASHLGWYPDEGFLCHEGVITAEGLRAHERVVPHPVLLNRAPFYYGMGDRDRAREVLREVLTFHDEMTVAVFGAWWAACLLKWHITKVTALFPLMVLEAPSETGKTNGFFNLMMQLSGHRSGQGVYTEAALRDALGSHMNGQVWIDDPTTLARFWEELRQSTSGGSRTKKGQDNTEQVTVRMVAPVVLSGEGFAEIRREKALADRAVLLPVTSPTERMSLRDPSCPQWDDIVDLVDRESELTKYAGTMVQMALENVDLVHEIRKLRVGVGRCSDKNAIIRLGARLLARLAGDDHWILVADQWVNMQDNDDSHSNALTMQILPETLVNDGVPRKPALGIPVFVDEDGVIWFSDSLLAHRWQKSRHSDREKQLGSLSSIQQQRKALDISGKGRVFTLHDGRANGTGLKQSRFHGLSLEQSAKVLFSAGIMLDTPLSQYVSDDTQTCLDVKQ